MYDRVLTQPGSIWYGWQTLIADTVGVGLVSLPFLDSYDDEGTLFGVGIFVWIFASPTVHFAHGKVGIGFASFGLRVTPLALLMASFACGFTGGENCENPFYIGLGLVPVAIALDAAVFAYERGPIMKARIRRRSSAPSRAALTLRPWHVAARDAWGLELAGGF